jgi:rhodanese-related sulfurtransferase
MAIDQIVNAIKQMQDLIEDNKEHLKNGEYVDLCNSMQSVYNCASAIKKAGMPNDADGTSDEDDDEDDDEEVQIVHTPRSP